MARYTGPKTKIARKFGEAIFGDDKSFEKRNYPPGQHGNNRRRGKKSEYAIQLTVNGELVNIPSYTLKAGDVVGVREKSKSLKAIDDALSANSSVYEWITWNSEKMEGNFVSVPERMQIPENIKEQLIVELYSK